MSKELIYKWVNAFNRADADALSALYHLDATNHQMPTKLVTGREAIKVMFEAEFSATEMTCIVEGVYEDGDHSILEWSDPSGLRGCGFFQIQGELIIHQRGYWDSQLFAKSSA